MDLFTLLIVIGILCLMLWVVNASGWIPLPPPGRLIFNLIVLVVFIAIVLHVSGIYSFHNVRIGSG